MGLFSGLCFCWFKGRVERGWSGPSRRRMVLALNRFPRGATQLRASWAGLANTEAFPKPIVARGQRSVKTMGRLDKPFHCPPNLILSIRPSTVLGCWPCTRGLTGR